jgi:hypothetical protein
MYYDASGTDYISTPSFAIPNTGVLTVEAWMKSKLNASTYQNIIGDGSEFATIGFLYVNRGINSNDFRYRYANGTDTLITFSNFFQNIDDQWIHIL